MDRAEHLDWAARELRRVAGEAAELTGGWAPDIAAFVAGHVALELSDLVADSERIISAITTELVAVAVRCEIEARQLQQVTLADSPG